MNNKRLTTLFCGLTLSCAYATSFAGAMGDASTDLEHRNEVYASALFLQPASGNLKYAVFVAGQQPYLQSWNYQTIKPDYSPAFELGLNYTLKQTELQTSVNWLHLHTSDSSFKQASESLNLTTIEFVAPFYEVGPPAFGIKRADSNVKFGFDSVNLNVNKLFAYGEQIRAKIFGGVNILSVKQKITTVFSDMPGALPTAYSYGLPPDPAFVFETQNYSNYLGAGPDLGLNVQYLMMHGLGVMGEMSGSITAGQSQVVNNFYGNSTRLINLGLAPTHQQITVPNSTQIVTGFDGKLGLFYHYSNQIIHQLTVEAGYRVAFYANAISELNPATLVQAGTLAITPEFATGTMAINSTEARERNFGFNGPFVNFKLTV